MVVAVLPSTMPSGSGLVNSKRIDSPSSSRASSIAVTVNDVDVAVRPIVTDDGAPLWSAAVAPPWCVRVSPIVVEVAAGALSSTITVAGAPPSVAVYEDDPKDTRFGSSSRSRRMERTLVDVLQLVGVLDSEKCRWSAIVQPCSDVCEPLLVFLKLNRSESASP